MGRRRLLDRETILATALEVADDEGLAGLTMAAVADRLGVTPMALYRHVGTKNDLLDGVVELLLTEIEPAPADLPWSERLREMAQAIRAVAHRHPEVFPLLLRRPAVTERARASRDSVVAALVEAGVDADGAARIERLLSTGVLGFAASEVSGRFRHLSRAELDHDFEQLLELLAAGLAGSGLAQAPVSRPPEPQAPGRVASES